MIRDFRDDYCGSQIVLSSQTNEGKTVFNPFSGGLGQIFINTPKALTENQIPLKIARLVRAALLAASTVCGCAGSLGRY